MGQEGHARRSSPMGLNWDIIVRNLKSLSIILFLIYKLQQWPSYPPNNIIFTHLHCISLPWVGAKDRLVAKLRRTEHNLQPIFYHSHCPWSNAGIIQDNSPISVISALEVSFYSTHLMFWKSRGGKLYSSYTLTS